MEAQEFETTLKLSGKTAYLLGLDYQVRDEIPWQEAVTHVLLGKMSPFLVHPTRRVRSAGGEIDMAWPLIVRLNYWVKVPVERPVDLHTRANRYEILKRDGHTCAYCGDPANTVDHVIPESRCRREKLPHNGWTWGNLVAACKPCNGMKQDRTPEQAGMKLRWHPHTGASKFAHVQDEIWRILENGGGFIPEANSVEGILVK